MDSLSTLVFTLLNFRFNPAIPISRIDEHYSSLPEDLLSIMEVYIRDWQVGHTRSKYILKGATRLRVKYISTIHYNNTSL